MPCPICRRPVPLDDPKAPFCSDRCRILDLANWATGKYAIPAVEHDPIAEEEDPDVPENSDR